MAREFCDDLRARAERFGHRPDDIKVLPGVVPIVAATRAMADDRRALLDSLADPQAGLSTLSYHLDIDLSQFPQEEMLPDLDVPGGLEDFARLAVPELQRRGLFRTGYDGTTLRAHLGLPRPAA